MTADWVVRTLDKAAKEHGAPEIINSDQGSQFTSNEYRDFLKDKGIKIYMDGKGVATDNAFINRLFRTLKYEKIYIEVPENGISLKDCCS